MRNALLPAGLLLALGVSSLHAQTQRSLLVLSKHDHTLAIVDPSTLKVTAKVPVGNDPHEVIASTDGTTAYVSNYGFGAYNTLTVVDLGAAKALGTIDLGALRGPHGLAFADGKVWFTSEVAKAVGRYDPATHTIDLILGTGQNRIHMINVSADTQHVVATNVNSGTVSLIDQQAVHAPMGPPPGAPAMPRTDWNETVVPVGHGSEGFDISPDRREIWVANAQDGTVSIIDYASKKVVQTLTANVPRANRLKFTPDGKLVLISAGPDLVILDAATRTEVKRLTIGHGGSGVLIQPDGTRAFVSCSPDNYVAVIDLHKLEVVGHLQVGGEPDGLAWAVRR
jgi:YVTN family beta-propeller protein